MSRLWFVFCLFVVFLCGMVCVMNLSNLVPTNCKHESSWINVIYSLVVAWLWGYLAWKA